jgi:fused signal recognition particle receptor
MPIVRQVVGNDLAFVAIETLQSAKAQNAVVVIIDTVTRFHNKVNLMNELRKIIRVMDRVIPNVPHEVFLIHDGKTVKTLLKRPSSF